MATFSPLQFSSARGGAQGLRQELIFPAELHVDNFSSSIDRRLSHDTHTLINICRISRRRALIITDYVKN